MSMNQLNARGTTLAFGLILGLLGHQASAANDDAAEAAGAAEAIVSSSVSEIVAYGDHQLALIRVAERLFATETERYLEALSHRVESDSSTTLEFLAVPKLQLATNEVPTRG